MLVCALGAAALTAAALMSCTSFDCVYYANCAAIVSEVDVDVPDVVEEVEAAPPPAKNPYGVDYPTEHLGWRIREGESPGEVIPNVVFEKGLESRTGSEPALVEPREVQLAEFFDPDTRTHDVIVLVLAEAAEGETRNFFEDELTFPQRTVVLSALGYGYTRGVAPSLEHFKTWADEHPRAWHVLDGKFEKLANLRTADAGASALTIALIDARSMELAHLWTGAVPWSELETEIVAIRARPKAY